MKYYLFVISILFIACDNPLGEDDPSCDYCYLDIDAPDLELISNGNYRMYINPDSYNTWSQLRAYVGYDLEIVGWTTNTYNNVLNTPIVNGSSWSNEDGYAFSNLAVNPEHIGMTAKVYAGYYDNYGKQWLDSIYINFLELQ